MRNTHGIAEFGMVAGGPNNPYIRDANRIIGTGPSPSGIGIPLDPNRPMQGIINNQWWMHTRSGMEYYLNPDTIGVPVYEEMITTDETCYAAIEFLELATDAKIGPYVNSNPHIERTVNEWLANLETPWLDVLAEQDSETWAGHSCSEVACDYDGRYIRPVQIQSLHPGTVTYDLWLTDQNVPNARKNNLRAARQWRYAAYQSYLPRETIIQQSHGKRFGNFYGQSRLRTAWRSWYLKQKMFGDWAMCLSRYGSPHAVASVDDEARTIRNPITGVEVPILDFMATSLDQLARDGSMAITKDIELKLFQAKQAVGNDYEGFVGSCDRRIYRACLIPSLVGENGDTGSFALGAKHYDLFVLMLNNRARKKVRGNIEQFIKPLIILNWGVQKDYGSFRIEDFQQEDKKVIAEALQGMVQIGVIKPGIADDLNACRARANEFLETDFRPLTPAEVASQPLVEPDPVKRHPEIGGTPGAPPLEETAPGGTEASQEGWDYFPASIPEQRLWNRFHQRSHATRRRADFKQLSLIQHEIRSAL